MLKVGILKNFDSGTYKAGVQLAGSLTTYFDDLNVAKNVPSSALVVGNYVILAIPGGNPKDACVIATWPQGSPGGGAGSFLDLSDTPSSFSGQAGKVAKVNNAANALDFGLRTKVTFGVSTGDIWVEDELGDTPFIAKINGAPTATSVVYDTDTGENSLTGSSAVGKMVLHNLTRGNSRLIESADRATNTIITQSSTDDWADDDDITTQSQVNTQAGYVDIDLSGFVAASVTGIFILVFFKDTGAIGELVRLHPYETYSTPKAIPLWNKTTTLFDTLLVPLPVISQKITFLVTTSGAATAYLVLKYFGKFEDT